jgi:hypothetical protein
MAADIKIGTKVTKRLITGRYGKHGWAVLQDRLKEIETPKGYEYKLVKSLPDEEAFKKLRDAKYTQLLSNLVADAYSEAQSLRDELQEWYDNLPESFQNGDKGSALQDAVDALGGFCDDEPEVPKELAELKALYLPGKADSRSDRASEAAAQMQVAADRIDTWLEAMPGHKIHCSAESRAEIEQFRDKLREDADNLCGVEFPGMY